MKKAGDILNTVKKYALAAFIIISAAMNILNYIRTDFISEPGKLYEHKTFDIPAKDISEDKAAEKPEVSDTAETAESGEAQGSLIININSAGADELQRLSGIGPAKAEAIIEYREKYGGFVCIEEIMEVKGIGEGIFAKIREHISVD